MKHCFTLLTALLLTPLDALSAAEPSIRLAENGTVRLSRDEGKTWPVSRLLVPGVFRYNCLAQLADGTLLCLFEQGPTKTPKITLARITPGWVVQARP